ncbi:MAG: helix-turn-helix domain-containing protein [Alteromonas sp.]|nr:helix-turn-helix domain-containing protein [Alteromonas sp.]NKX19260.1 helix-turn-helix transcriptional regulator [Alteromonadaceae bacterium A_SAG8]NKX69045.1 helix-turn-helix transcriptional regulator [Alteromonadaceae bacterium A_SAG7]
MRIKTPKDVGHYIASTRKALGWSQTDLATKIGKDQRFVSRLENDPTSVSFGTVLMVLNVLNINIDIDIDIDMTNQNTHKTDGTAAVAGGQRIPQNAPKDVKSPLRRVKSGKFVSKPTRTPVVVSKNKAKE